MRGQRSTGAVGDCGDKVLTIVAGAVAVDVEVDAGLKDGVAAGVAVNADPGGRRISRRAATTGRCLRRGDDESAGHGLVAAANKHSTRPVGAVLDKGVVAGLTDIVGLDHGRGLASETVALRLLAGLTAFTALLREPGGEGGLGADEDADGRRELHFDFVCKM